MIVKRAAARLAFGLLCLLPAAAARGETLPERAIFADPRERIEISNPAGSILVVGWPKSELRYGGTTGPKSGVLRLEQGAASITLAIQEPPAPAPEQLVAATLVVAVPEMSTLTVRSTSADIRVDAVAGDVTIETLSGRVFVSGDDASAGSKVRVTTVGGSVAASGALPELDVSSVGGDIVVRGTVTRIALRSTNGDIALEASELAGGAVSSIAGAISAVCTLRAGAALSLGSVSGDVKLWVARDRLPAISITAYSGAIDASRFSIDGKPVRVPSLSGGSPVELAAGGGNGSVTITDYTGTVIVSDQIPQTGGQL